MQGKVRKICRILPIVVVSLALLPGTATYGNGVAYTFRNYTDREGLSSNTIQCLYQDEKGYIWVGTGDGLDRFNSYDFTNYRYDYRRPYTIENNSIYSICAESVSDSDRIWVGTNDGLYVFDSGDESFTRLLLMVDGVEKDNVLVYSLCTDLGGNLWIGTLGAGLFRYNLKSETLEHYGTENYPGTFSSDVINKVLLDHDNNVWVACGDSIHRYNPETNLFSSFRVEDRAQGKTIGYVGALCQDSFGDIWIGGYAGELFKFEISGFKFTSYRSTSSFGRIRAMIEYEPGTIMIGSEGGLVGFDIKRRSFGLIDDGRGNATGSLSDKFIHSIIKDRDGGIWIGTYFGGLNYLSPLSSLFSTTEPPAECGQIISRMCEDSDGNVWIGSDDGGLSRFDPVSGRYEKVVFDPANPSPNIHALLIDGPWLWIGTYGSGLYRMDMRTRSITHFAQDGERVDNLNVYSLLRDSRGVLWIGTKQSICRFDESSGTVRRIVGLGVNRDVVDIKEDFFGNVWFASLGGGLMKTEAGGDSEIRSYSHELKISDYVSCLLVENDYLWIGTHGNGVCRYDISENGLTRNFDSTVYANSAIFQMILNGDEIWMTTNKGLLRYNFDSPGGSITRYVAEDGLLANIFNPNSGIKSSTGFIYIGCNNGINGFYPYDFTRRDNSTRLGVIFSDIKLFNRSVPVAENSILRETIDNQRAIVLTGGKKSVTIDFIAMNYAAPARTTYRYKLENFDEDRITYTGAGIQHVSYTNLPTGHYRFVVSAADGQETYGEESVVAIDIEPSFWAGNPMLFLYILLASGAVIMAAHYAANRIRRRHRLQIESMRRKNQMDMLEAKVNLFTEVANEIRTPVSLIATPLEKMAGQSGLSPNIDGDINIILKNCDRLLSLVDRMSDLDDAAMAGNGKIGGADPETETPEASPREQRTAESIYPQNEGVPTAEEKDRPQVLLLDNNPDFVDFFTRHLSERFSVIAVRDDKEAWETLQAKSIAAIVASLDMSEFDATGFIPEIRNNPLFDHIPVVAVSLDKSLGARVGALKAGADAYIEKPLMIDHILAQLEALLERRKRLRLKFSKTPYFVTDETGTESGNNFMERVNTYITGNISSSHLSVDDMAEAVGMGRSTFFSRLKAITGSTPNEYLRIRRLKLAAELLSADNGLRINEIGYMVGFSSTSYFSKCFLAEFGLSPGEFREKYQPR